MTFYAESYFSHQQQLFSMINYGVIIVLSLLILFNATRYLRHHMRTRNKDLGIIFFLLLLIFVGLQITNIENEFNRSNQTSEMRPFIEAVARDHGLKSNQVFVNSQTLTDGILVRFDKKDYRVNLSPTGDNYTLTRAHVVDHSVKIVR
ncbi:MAG: DUF3290 family protein [Limosilactobacillus sp.]|uniref:DUF3290 family protein n=1 Tax=Limosilactobacillus sp. TaxID=2773925 RepID=UPI00270036B2|nr:DUF3290 family protein [Limosilactobacillus sp.]